MITGLNIYIRIGALEVQRCPEFKISMQRHKPLTTMKVVLPDPQARIMPGINLNDEVLIRFGYSGQSQGSYKSTVSGMSSYDDKLFISITGTQRPLIETVITQAFEDETPEAIIKWAITQTGMASGRIDSPGVVLPRFAAGTIPAWQVARQCEHTCEKAFGIDMSQWALWQGKDEKINWGNFDSGIQCVLS